MSFYAVIKDYESVVCLGDYVGVSGKNRDSNKCIDLLKKRKGRLLLGNHDLEVIGGSNHDSDIRFVVDDVEYRYDYNIREDNKDWLKRRARMLFKASLHSRVLLFAHSYCLAGHFQYLDNMQIIGEYLGKIEGRDSIAFVGHTHVPGLFSFVDNRQLTRHKVIYQEWVPLEAGKKYLVNVGSIGEPRDGSKDGTFVLFDSDHTGVMFCHAKVA